MSPASGEEGMQGEAKQADGHATGVEHKEPEGKPCGAQCKGENEKGEKKATDERVLQEEYAVENSGVVGQESSHVHGSLEGAANVGGSSGVQTSVGPVASAAPVSAATPTSAAPSGDAANVSQLTDILLAKLITTLSDSTLGNPALLLQTLLGFSPEDYNDLLAALSESGCSYVDIIAAYLHNIRVMSEDSGSTSAALSGTLTRSLIEQYNGLLAQALRAPRNHGPRANLTGGIGDVLGQGNMADLLLKPGIGGQVPAGAVRPSGTGSGARRSFDNGMNRGPSGLGFGRRSLDSVKSRINGMMDFQNQGPGIQRLMSAADPAQLTQSIDAMSIRAKRGASIDLGQMLGGHDGTPQAGFLSNQHMNPAVLQRQVLPTATPEQLVGLLQNGAVNTHPFIHQAAPVQMNPNGIANVGMLNPVVGLMQSNLPALQPGVPGGVSAHVAPPGASAAIAGTGIMPEWPQPIAMNHQGAISPMHLAAQAGPMMQWEHLATIHENIGQKGVFPSAPGRVLGNAAIPSMPMNGVNPQTYQSSGGGSADGYAGTNS